jgi:hypothetical protein
MWRTARHLMLALTALSALACMPDPTGYSCDAADCVVEQGDATLETGPDAGDAGHWRYCPNENACQKDEVCVDSMCVPAVDAGVADEDAGVIDAGLVELDGGENDPTTVSDGGISCNSHAECPDGLKCKGRVCR